jgi:hypothetical protein
MKQGSFKRHVLCAVCAVFGQIVTTTSALAQTASFSQLTRVVGRAQLHALDGLSTKQIEP